MASTLAADAGSFAVPGVVIPAMVEIPTLSMTGGAVLALLLAAAGLWVGLRRSCSG